MARSRKVSCIHRREFPSLNSLENRASEKDREIAYLKERVRRLEAHVGLLPEIRLHPELEAIVYRLTPVERETLRALFEFYEKRFVPRSFIHDYVHGVAHSGDERNVDIHLSRLRKQLPANWKIDVRKLEGWRLLRIRES